MYLVDRNQNRIKEIEKKTFSELGIRERDHLQEWLAYQPGAFGEDLLIIQKEFDGFHDTNERLDLLALDTDGNIVIIENKLDDSGKNVTWQALKYASYCSRLTKENIRSIYQEYLDKKCSGENAEDNLSDFFHQEYDEIVLNRRQTQRIIIVAANFRKEVTSNVLWLLDFKIRIQCFKTTPYELDGQLFLTLEQIIPTIDTEDYIISMAEKTQEEISSHEIKEKHKLRLDFWSKILPRLKGKTPIYQNISPTKDHWLHSGGTGISSTRYSLLFTGKYAGVNLEFGRPNREENKRLFDELSKYRTEIEDAFGHSLNWERLDDKISSRVSYKLQDVSIENPEDWDKAIEFISDNIIALEKVMSGPLNKVKGSVFGTGHLE